MPESYFKYTFSRDKIRRITDNAWLVDCRVKPWAKGSPFCDRDAWISKRFTRVISQTDTEITVEIPGSLLKKIEDGLGGQVQGVKEAG